MLKKGNKLVKKQIPQLDKLPNVGVGVGVCLLIAQRDAKIMILIIHHLFLLG